MSIHTRDWGDHLLQLRETERGTDTHTQHLKDHEEEQGSLVKEAWIQKHS